MRKVRKIIALLFVAGALWLFYGNTFHESGLQGVVEEIRSDVNQIIDNPSVNTAIDHINNGMQQLFGMLTENRKYNEQPEITAPEKPQLDTPSEHTFSIHNVELGENRSDVEQQVGKPNRTTLNEYGVNWITYHENYQNFFMVAYNEHDQVIGLYTNQDLLTSTIGIDFTSSRASVLTALGEPLKGIQKGFINYQMQDTDEHDLFLIDKNYITIFYDKHENNTVTAIQIISNELEQQKDKFFAEQSEGLKEGFEYQLFDLTNAARVEHGLSTLSWEEPARKTSREHSTDMADNNYFSHTNLKGQSPFDRLEEDHISFRMAGENLASGQLSSIFAHEGLMNSLGHRENILKTDFELLAVGVAFNTESRPFFTETFLTN